MRERAELIDDLDMTDDVLEAIDAAFPDWRDQVKLLRDAINSPDPETYIFSVISPPINGANELPSETELCDDVPFSSPETKPRPAAIAEVQKPRLVSGNQTMQFQDAAIRAGILKPADTHLLATLLSFVGKRKKDDAPVRVYVEFDDIVERARVSESTIRRSIKRLKQCGLLIEEPRGKRMVRYLGWGNLEKVADFETERQKRR
jgi:DNA-binding transcriptional ArsR family regulator